MILQIITRYPTILRSKCHSEPYTTTHEKSLFDYSSLPAGEQGSHNPVPGIIHNAILLGEADENPQLINPCINHIDSTSYYKDMESCVSHTLYSTGHDNPAVSDFTRGPVDMNNPINRWVPFDHRFPHSIKKTDELMGGQSNLNEAVDANNRGDAEGICLQAAKYPREILYADLVDKGFSPGSDDQHKINYKLRNFFGTPENPGPGSGDFNRQPPYGIIQNLDSINLSDTDNWHYIRNRVTIRFRSENGSAKVILSIRTRYVLQSIITRYLGNNHIKEVNDIFKQIFYRKLWIMQVSKFRNLCC